MGAFVLLSLNFVRLVSLLCDALLYEMSNELEVEELS